MDKETASGELGSLVQLLREETVFSVVDDEESGPDNAFCCGDYQPRKIVTLRLRDRVGVLTGKDAEQQQASDYILSGLAARILSLLADCG